MIAYITIASINMYAFFRTAINITVYLNFEKHHEEISEDLRNIIIL